MADGPLPAGLVSAWERLLHDPARLCLDPVTGVCEAVFADGVVFPLQRQRELSAMLKLAAERKPRVVMEIGTDKGGGLLHWCLLPTVTHVAACEIRGTPYRHLLERAFPHLNFCWLPCGSREHGVRTTIACWLDDAGGETGPAPCIDVLFLDGEKAAFEADFDAYLPLMNPAGLVLMHDVTDQDTGDAYQRVKARGRYACREIIDRGDSERAMERERQGLPPASSHEGWCRHWRGASCGVGVIELAGKKAGSS